MNIQEIIAKKRDKNKLSKEEIEYFVQNYTNENIADYQAAALVMAIYINGMDEEETTNLTLAMAHSGDILDLSELGTVVDKHSTGGIGDKITLILAPIISSFDIPVAKMSGKGLGYTGGTIDKLESIPNYKTNLTIEEFIQKVKQNGIAVISQTLKLAPADKKLYALRDVISATESIPLISSSIMSKKIAAGASKIVLDVTCGIGAFMKNLKDAEKLAKMMKKIGELAHKETICIITNMEEPLGKTVGNSLEVIESVEFLKGNMEQDVKEVILELGSYMLKLAGKGENIKQNKQKILNNIENGKAFEKFKVWIESQNGDISFLEDYKKLKKAKYIVPVLAQNNGYVTSLNAQKVGEISRNLGAGRIKKEDIILPEVGVVLEKKVGYAVQKGEILAYIHANNEELANSQAKELQKVYEIQNNKPEPKKNVLKVI